MPSERNRPSFLNAENSVEAARLMALVLLSKSEAE